MEAASPGVVSSMRRSSGSFDRFPCGLHTPSLNFGDKRMACQKGVKNLTKRHSRLPDELRELAVDQHPFALVPGRAARAEQGLALSQVRGCLAGDAAGLAHVHVT